MSLKKCFKFKPPSRESTFIIIPIPGVLHSYHFSLTTRTRSHCQCSVSLSATSLQSHSFDYFGINSIM